MGQSLVYGRNFSLFLLNKLKNPTLSKPFLVYYWPLDVIKAPFAYFKHQIRSKPSLDYYKMRLF